MEPTTRALRVLLPVLPIVGAALRLGVSWQPIPWLIDSHPTHAFLIDDSLLAHSIARNLALGRGLTADGVHATNGFQPLYVFLVAPFYTVTGGERILPLHLALSFLSLVNVACGFLLYRLTRRFASATTACVALAVWCLAPDVVRLGINGLETSLATLWVLWATDYYLRGIRIPQAPTLARFAKLGLLLGLAGLTRVDALAFAVAIGVDVLWLAFRHGRARDWLRGLALAALIALAVVVPWSIYSTVQYGSPLPESGEAVRFASLDRYGHEPPPTFYLDNVRESFAAILDDPALPGWRSWSGRPYHLPEPRALWINGPLLALALGVLAWRSRHSRRDNRDAGERSASPAHLGFIVVYAAVMIAAYAFWILGPWFYPRYFYPLLPFVILPVVVAVEAALSSIPRVSLRHLLIAGLLAMLGSAWLMQWRHLSTRPGDCGYHALARWLAANTGPDDTIGAFQSGTLAYLLDLRVVNLDGVVNREALAALERERAFDYVLDEGITVLADWNWVIDVSLLRNSRGQEPRLEPAGRLCQFGIYRVVRSPERAP